MALSRRDLTIASLSGFIAWGLAVRWLPVLRYIGYAFVVGLSIAAACLGAVVLLTVRSGNEWRANKASLAGTSVAFLSPDKWEQDVRIYEKSVDYRPDPLYPRSFLVSEALSELLDLALRDFVSSWYQDISGNPRFISEVDRGIRAVLGNLRDRLLREDLVEILVSRIVPILTSHFRDFDKAERAVRGRNLSRTVTESEELEIAIASRYRDGNLHPAISLSSFSDPKQVQQEHLRKLVVTLLPQLLPEGLMNSRAVAVLIREIVTCAVLYPLMSLLSDPDTWNQLMEAYARTALQDRKTVRKLRAALDQHASPAPKTKQNQTFPRLRPGDSEREFERFVRVIRRCNILSDARRFRSQIASQLKRESMVEGQDQVYLRRLETGKRVLDQKVSKLSALSGQSKTTPVNPVDLRYSYISNPQEVSLVDVMHNAAGLSYFMEYMDRLNLMSLVQFWVVVDGVRNPLEDDFGDDTPSNAVTWTTADRNDVVLISEQHLSKPELRVPPESRQAVKDFINAGKRATPAQYRKARTVILTTQTSVLLEMQNKYYPDFKKSDLYYKYLASDEAASASASIPHPERPTINRSAGSEGSERRPLPPLIGRAASPQSNTKPNDLLRAAVSTTDLLKSSKHLNDSHFLRRSLDSDRAPLFDDDPETDPLVASTQSIGKDSQNGDGGDGHSRRVIETMEAALNDIITNEPNDSRLEDTKSSLLHPSRDQDSSRSSLESPQLDNGPAGEKGKPSIASLGLVNTSSRIGVFADNDLFSDEEKFIEDEYADPETQEDEKDPAEEIHEAAPGDLGLAEAISALTSDIEKLIAQEAVVDTLTRKAELTNNTAELRILRKSKSSLQRELRRKEMQRQQYIIQESDNSLYGRSTVQIKSIMVGKEEDGREYALYLIEVQRNSGDQMSAASWAIPRRYSEFHELHHRLRMRYPSVRNLEFPRRRMVMKLQKDFLHKRRLALEAYLQQLLLLPEVCRSRDLRAFLSQRAIIASDDSNHHPPHHDLHEENKDLVTRIYNSVADGMDDFLGNITVLDQLSTAGQNLISAATNQLATTNTNTPTTQPDHLLINPEDSVTAAEAEAELNAFEDRELEPFVKPICDMFLEIFELNRGNNWLRGRAVVVVLHQLLGGTVERKVRESARALVHDSSLLRYINLAKDTLWPITAPAPAPAGDGAAGAVAGGEGFRKLREAKPRSLAEKMKSRTEASVMLATLVPDLAASVVGRANAQAAARRLFATTNNQRLNAHLVFTILDEVVFVLFGGGGGGGGVR
ncbi:intermediate filament protein [Blastomyces gilchristii SLH14081]|uniref:Intermediate filament protein n=1 Tax=Blastomyces gilchristii (strain SLH14081) TaxID=559298 RepID=A0A179ULN7_BLAGS|nr:intermediate filament protein [Blastomyces gilchristii SLH14081]OAT07921.1 intermediate filament protein [Blastomyces gilchristii SLH14081]